MCGLNRNELGSCVCALHVQIICKLRFYLRYLYSVIYSISQSDRVRYCLGVRSCAYSVANPSLNISTVCRGPRNNLFLSVVTTVHELIDVNYS